ncbi:nicotinate phosphoribosyltransferase [Sulfidibacter corallicola]|uniref:Nicotinate phosphoribosyltransferase n=1 Tax=Sulfidibacter corallicola TaxID=2818388 RepID=A0A8A4TIL4_SULCO|nr:nicotinate phosphoribosyltransferase [Sulfidibacter corallicola]QTD49390.1 nicotinate phosphoribosyltransferase [Sulfidibacter corallicola]
MSVPSNLAMLTDLYQLTMAAGYWKHGRADSEAVFNLFFRKPPFGGGYAVFCGLTEVIEFLQSYRFGDEEVAYLATLRGHDGKALFPRAFLDYLAGLELTCEVAAPPEGTVVFANQPLIRLRGPLLQCQLLETTLLNLINFPTLVATKAARVAQAAQGDPVLEFGLRRAQGIDGGITASRAAYVGGCAATSNVLAGQRYGIPVKGTHAHSWVMSYEDELQSFEAYAAAMPNNCILLVDTYDTLEGVRHAIEVGRRLRGQGQELMGIRLDSGDLCALSKKARGLLDAAGFHDTRIVASNDLDEFAISQLKRDGAAIDVWGVGTKLATAYDQPALGGVYKLTALREHGDAWRYKLKLSEQEIKISLPGILQVRRFEQDGRYIGDMIYEETLSRPERREMVPYRGGEAWTIPASATSQDLLQPVFRDGSVLVPPESVHRVRARAGEQLAMLPEGVRAMIQPDPYPCGVESELFRLKTSLIKELRESTETTTA